MNHKPLNGAVWSTSWIMILKILKFFIMKLFNYIIKLIRNTQRKCVYIFCDNNLYYHMRWWLDGKGLELKIQTSLWTSCVCYIITMICIVQFIELKKGKKKKQRNKQAIKKIWHWSHRDNATLDSSIVQSRNK